MLPEAKPAKPAIGILRKFETIYGLAELISLMRGGRTNELIAKSHHNIADVFGAAADGLEQKIKRKSPPSAS
jgi:hypothetical protein